MKISTENFDNEGHVFSPYPEKLIAAKILHCEVNVVLITINSNILLLIRIL